MRALLLFREEHAEIVPVDLQAFVRLSPWLPLALVWILAQLWEPTALEVVMRRSRVKPSVEHAELMANGSEALGCKGPPKLSANDLTVIMADTAEEMSARHENGVGRSSSRYKARYVFLKWPQWDNALGSWSRPRRIRRSLECSQEASEIHRQSWTKWSHEASYHPWIARRCCCRRISSKTFRTQQPGQDPLKLLTCLYMEGQMLKATWMNNCRHLPAGATLGQSLLVWDARLCQ